MRLVDYQAAAQPSFWEMLGAQLPHLALTLVTWPMFSSMGAGLAAQIASKWPQLAGMAQHVAGAVPLVGTSLASTVMQYLMGDPMTAAQMQRQMALQRLAQMQQRRQELMQQLMSGSIGGYLPQQ